MQRKVKDITKNPNKGSQREVNPICDNRQSPMKS